MMGARGPRSVPLDGRRRTPTRTGCPSGYARANVTSTRPFATATGRTRSPVGGGATGAAGAQAKKVAPARSQAAAGTPRTLLGAAAEEELLEVGQRGAQADQEEQPDDEAR